MLNISKVKTRKKTDIQRCKRTKEVTNSFILLIKTTNQNRKEKILYDKDLLRPSDKY